MVRCALTETVMMSYCFDLTVLIEEISILRIVPQEFCKN